MAQKSQRIFEGCQSLKTIFIVFKKNEFGHTRISCFFYHIGQTVIYLLHSELGIDQILNRIEEQKGELTHCACLTSLVQLHHCAHIIYYCNTVIRTRTDRFGAQEGPCVSARTRLEEWGEEMNSIEKKEKKL